MAHHQTGTKNSTSKNPPGRLKRPRHPRPYGQQLSRGRRRLPTQPPRLRGNTREKTHISTSITTEGEMTANVLLEALGTTLAPELLVEALTHRSFSHEHPGAKNYERLEFLGDAVLELVSTETLYAAHPDMTEGQLAKMRAKAVSEESLSHIAREKLHVGPYILLGNGEAEQHGAEKSSILCDIVESLIGATFIQHGIDEARKVVHHLVDDTLAEVTTEWPGIGLEDLADRQGP